MEGVESGDFAPPFPRRSKPQPSIHSPESGPPSVPSPAPPQNPGSPMTTPEGSQPSPGPSAEDRRRAACTAMASAPGLVRYAARFTRSLPDAEDAYQRAMEIALVSAPVVEPRRFRAWLHTVVRNEAIAISRARRREGPAGGEDAALTASRSVEDPLASRRGGRVARALPRRAGRARRPDREPADLRDAQEHRRELRGDRRGHGLLPAQGRALRAGGARGAARLGVANGRRAGVRQGPPGARARRRRVGLATRLARRVAAHPALSRLPRPAARAPAVLRGAREPGAARAGDR